MSINGQVLTLTFVVEFSQNSSSWLIKHLQSDEKGHRKYFDH